MSTHRDAKYAREVKDVAVHFPEKDKYQTLKQALTQKLSTSQEQSIKQILKHEKLGNRRSSQYYLQILANTTVSDQLRTLIDLPSQMQTILITQTEDRKSSNKWTGSMK